MPLKNAPVQVMSPFTLVPAVLLVLMVTLLACSAGEQRGRGDLGGRNRRRVLEQDIVRGGRVGVAVPVATMLMSVGSSSKVPLRPLRPVRPPPLKSSAPCRRQVWTNRHHRLTATHGTDAADENGWLRPAQYDHLCRHHPSIARSIFRTTSRPNGFVTRSDVRILCP